MNPLWLILGALLGYLLVMWSNPIRASLRDGLRVLRRYPALWLTFGIFGFGYALFDLGVRLYLFCSLPPGQGPFFIWARSPYRPDWSWIYGLRDSLWYLQATPGHGLARAAVLPALDSTAGIFNNYTSTFPLAAIAGLLLLINFDRRQSVLFQALRKRYGGWGWLPHAGILLCALAALIKPALFVLPNYLDGTGLAIWAQWSRVIAWPAFLFEYLFGIYIQVYLILLAYCWVRGISFRHEHLLDFAIRRSSFVLRWAAVVMLLSTVFIDLPLILKNFARFHDWFSADEATLNHRLSVARVVIDAILLFFATMQITLIFHSESLRKAFHSHAVFVFRNAWPFGWFLVLTVLHFYLLHTMNIACLGGFGEGTALWVAWRLAFPWMAGIVGAWLLASWVCIYRRCNVGRTHAQPEDWIQF